MVMYALLVFFKTKAFCVLIVLFTINKIYVCNNTYFMNKKSGEMLKRFRLITIYY